MSLVLDGLVLGKQDISVHLDLFLSLLHGHFQLVLLVLEGIHIVSRLV